MIQLKRILLITISLAGWFWTQSLIGARVLPEKAIGDATHRVSESVHGFLLTNEAAANTLLITSSFVIDVIGVSLLLLTIFGPSIRPFLALFITLGLRQLCQALNALPAPAEMIWHHPGFPSILVTYGVSTDLFFSGHTAIAVLGALELFRAKRRSLMVLGIAIIVFEVSAVLVLRAHYFMDVYAGAVTAVLIAMFSARIAPQVDTWLKELAARGD